MEEADWELNELMLSALGCLLHWRGAYGHEASECIYTWDMGMMKHESDGLRFSDTILLWRDAVHKMMGESMALAKVCGGVSLRNVAGDVPERFVMNFFFFFLEYPPSWLQHAITFSS